MTKLSYFFIEPGLTLLLIVQILNFWISCLLLGYVATYYLLLLWLFFVVCRFWCYLRHNFCKRWNSLFCFGGLLCLFEFLFLDVFNEIANSLEIHNSQFFKLIKATLSDYIRICEQLMILTEHFNFEIYEIGPDS